MRERICAALRDAGAAACGVCSRAALTPYMTDAQRARLEETLPGWTAVVVAAFSYYVDTPRPPHALSRYAWGLDYHAVLREHLQPAADVLRDAGAHAAILVDASPIPERAAACLAGIGMLGSHGLVIVPKYGSHVFLGTIVTNAALDANDAAIAHCADCGACRAACPTGALSANGYDITRCLSDISQKKGELSAWERESLRENDCVWGCDACQAVCPHNRDVRETEITEFRKNLLQVLRTEDLDGLSNRAFHEKFDTRAFTWRGPAVLRRNLKIVTDTQNTDEK